MSRLKTCLGLLLALTLVGCAQPPKKQAYNQAAATHIKTLVIANDPDQDRYEAVLLGHPAMGFGLVGGLIARPDMQTKGTRLTEALVPAETRLQQRLGETMSQGLNRIVRELKVPLVGVMTGVLIEGASAHRERIRAMAAPRGCRCRIRQAL